MTSIQEYTTRVYDEKGNLLSKLPTTISSQEKPVGESTSVSIVASVTQGKKLRELHAVVLDPAGKSIETQVVLDGKGRYKIDFTPTVLETYQTSALDEKGNLLQTQSSREKPQVYQSPWP